MENVLSLEQKHEAGIKDALMLLWKNKALIILVTAFFGVISIFYVKSLPDVYQSSVLLKPQLEQNMNNGMAAQLGGLAGLAGINLGKSDDKSQLALALLQSRSFLFFVIEKYEMKADLIAAIGWDKANNKVIYDDEIYSKKDNLWLEQDKDKLKMIVSVQNAYRHLKEIMTVSSMKGSNMVIISIEHYSPYIAKEWVDILVYEINEKLKADDIKKSEKSISFLKEAILESELAAMESKLYTLIEREFEVIMFANSNEEYFFKTVDPAIVEDKKSGPARALLVILITFLGSVLSVVFLLIRNAFK